MVHAADGLAAGGSREAIAGGVTTRFGAEHHPPSPQSKKGDGTNKSKKSQPCGKLVGRGFYYRYGRSLAPLTRACFTNVVANDVPDKWPPLSASRSPLAILVYQGSDPTQPYPTLVIRDRAPRFSTAFRLGDVTTLFGLRQDGRSVRSDSPDVSDSISFTSSLAKTAGRISLMALGPDPRFLRSRASSSANDAASSRWSEWGS